MIGERYGNRTILGEPFKVAVKVASKAKGYTGISHVVVRCDCGAVDVVVLAALKQGRVNTCKPCGQTTHGMTKTKAYQAAVNAQSRCNDCNNPGYKHYGGRGIEFGFDGPADMARYIADLPGYGEPGMSIDRIDNDGHYERGNLRWATRSEQTYNQRRNLRQKEMV